MLSKNIKELKAKKADEARKNDIKLYRLMVEFVLTVVAVALAVMAGNNNTIFINGRVMPVLLLVSGILFAASAIFYAAGKNKANSDYKIITRGAVFGNLAVLFFGCAHFYLFYNAQSLIMAIIASAVLYFTYNVFGGRMFIYSLVSVAGFIVLDISKLNGSGFSYIANGMVFGAEILAFVIPVAALVYVILCGKNQKGGKNKLLPVLIPAALTLAGAVLNFAYPSAVIFVIFGLVGCYLFAAVAYSVKNM